MSGAKSPATLQTSEVKQCCASLYESDRARGLKPLTGRSRHNLPNPIVNPPNPYVPTNSPAMAICSTCSVSVKLRTSAIAIRRARFSERRRKNTLRRDFLVPRVCDPPWNLISLPAAGKPLVHG
jgi:hypothetical protein